VVPNIFNNNGITIFREGMPSLLLLDPLESGKYIYGVIRGNVIVAAKHGSLLSHIFPCFINSAVMFFVCTY
jgi:hypothetical protein